MTRGRHRRPAALATLPDDDDDILSEILLRLPPRPSSLPRASLVCKRWRRLITDPHFRRRFRSRHPNPPLLGFFDEFVDFTFFKSVMDLPDRIPPRHFCPPIVDEKGGCDRKHWRNFGCRHGRVLLYNRKQKEVVVWDPPTGDHRQVAVPPEFDNEERMIWNGAVLCAAASDHSHVHGGFCSCPFKVAVVGVTLNHTQVFASIYSSQTGKWSNLVSAAVPFVVYYVARPGVLVGNALYWMPLGHGYGIAEFDLDTHTLALVECSSGAKDLKGRSRILLAQNGVLCLAILSGHSLQMWERKVCSEGVASWVLRKSDKLQKILGRRSIHKTLGNRYHLQKSSLCKYIWFRFVC
ncbi:uncharacterized protein LOC110437414 isoform X3 [Sorghum bicolor]|uniref:uncharacterized protein LOC110437414 isoform X3 n=1 Tax=Sorghum bicolor TaxID=4558 RepID=UPI000B423765|nr:uncharacterized protein LOC110437414 isoform X3 [Sorghum bicolor]|eukprot:XP_021321576.1 uncharacterized protein LOC110437414 isoform X3 [Sorghum bicolor]